MPRPKIVMILFTPQKDWMLQIIWIKCGKSYKCILKIQRHIFKDLQNSSTFSRPFQGPFTFKYYSRTVRTLHITLNTQAKILQDIPEQDARRTNSTQLNCIFSSNIFRF